MGIHDNQEPKPMSAVSGKFASRLPPEKQAARDKKLKAIEREHAAWVKQHQKEINKCSVRGCRNKYKSKGYCQAHYNQSKTKKGVRG